jgi:LTXXQ motif family protein
MRRGLACCACFWASLAASAAQADILGGMVRGITAAPRAVMGGLFGGARGRHHYHHHTVRRDRHYHTVRREAPAPSYPARDQRQLSSWLGAVYWPAAYRDTFGYIFLGTNGTDAFWTHSSDDIYDGVFVPAMASSTVISDKPLDVPNSCAGEQNQPMSLEPIERTLHPTETQRARLDALHDALVQASDRMRVSCTAITMPLAPTARLEIIWDRLRAIRQVVGLVRTPLKALYDSLSDDQKGRLNALADSTSARRHGHVLEPQACAGIDSRSPEWLTKQIEEAVHPSDQQRASLVALTSTTSHLSALLQSSCPSATLVTPTGRLEAVASRLDSMIDAVTLERTALNDFYASLNDGQKARFGAEIRQPPRARDHQAPP